MSNLREAEESLFTDEPQPGTSKDVLGGGGPGGSSKGIDLVESGAPTPRRDDDDGLRDDGFGAGMVTSFFCVLNPCDIYVKSLTWCEIYVDTIFFSSYTSSLTFKRAFWL